MTPVSPGLRAELQQGLNQLPLELSEDQQDKLLKYLDLLNHWNKSINLTAVTDPLEQVKRHLLDSFSIDAYLKQSPVLDVGTGAGLPGIPLAIANPDQEWHLLDNSTKRISFLRVVITQLGLKNVKLINSRVEQYQSETKYPAIVCRAFASLRQITDNGRHLLASHGFFFAMKGQYPEQEIIDMSENFRVTECYPLRVPGLSEDRHLLKIQRRTE